MPGTDAPGTEGIDDVPGIAGAPGMDGPDGMPGTDAPGTEGIEGGVAPGSVGAEGTPGTDDVPGLTDGIAGGVSWANSQAGMKTNANAAIIVTRWVMAGYVSVVVSNSITSIRRGLVIRNDPT